jgi:subtilisin family serine protease
MALGPASIYGYMLQSGLPNQLAGGAFLLAPDLAVTCAHVVRDHLGLGKVTPKKAPKEIIKLHFPALDAKRDGNVISGGWYADPEDGGARLLRDVALIRLTKPLEDPELLFIPMAVTSPPAEGKGWIVGAGPGWQDYGEEIPVALGRAPNARGAWSVTDLKAHGATAVPGFSGSPLLGESMTVIWGMVQRVAGPGQRTTLVLPSDRVHEVLKAVAPGTSARRFSKLGINVVRGGLGDDQRVNEGVEIAPVGGAKPRKARAGNKVRAARTQQRNWGLDRLNIMPLWTLGLRGDGVRIGDISTGVDASHRLLKGRVTAYALTDNSGKLVPGAQPEDMDEGGFGTHTAGVLVGSDDKTWIGMAPNAELYVAQALEGGEVFQRILASLDWMLQHKVNVVNLSLGLRGYSPLFESAIAALRDADVICVASVGNEGPGTSRSPGNYRNVISVGAIDEQDRVADFSGSQAFDGTEPFSVPSLVAPGVNIMSAARKSGVVSRDGTSEAAPHVAGLAALLRQAAPQASAAAIRDAIFESCKKPVSQVTERVGRGVPDGVEAVRILAHRGQIDSRFLTKWLP